MDIEFTEEQELLRDSLQKMLRADYAFDARQAIARCETGFSKRHWRQFAELGLLSAPFSEAAGGLGKVPRRGDRSGVEGGQASPAPG